MFATAPRAGFIRRLAAILYDWLILCALVMFAASLAMLLVNILVWSGLLSLQGYTDVADFLNQGWQRWAYFIYLVASVMGFYLYFWCKAGQTLGMRAWRLLLVQQTGEAVTLRQAFGRALLSLFGLGNLWLWLRWGKGLALQDQLTATQVILLTKDQSKELNLHKKAR